jgi:hypothetical protein
MRDRLAQLEADMPTFAVSEPDEADERTYDNVQSISLWVVGVRDGPPPPVLVCNVRQVTGGMAVQRLAGELRAMTDGTGMSNTCGRSFAQQTALRSAKDKQNTPLRRFLDLPGRAG